MDDGTEAPESMSLTSVRSALVSDFPISLSATFLSITNAGTSMTASRSMLVVELEAVGGVGAAFPKNEKGFGSRDGAAIGEARAPGRGGRGGLPSVG